MQPNKPIAIYGFNWTFTGPKSMKLRSHLGLATTIAILASPQVEAASRYDDIFDLFLERTSDSEERASKPATKKHKPPRPIMRESQEALSIFDFFTYGGPAPKKKEAIKVSTPAVAVLPRAERQAVEPKPVQLRVKKHAVRNQAAIRPVVSPSKVSCNGAKAIIEKYAFGDVAAQNCGGDVYTFAATRTGKQFLVRVSALSGELIEVKRSPGAGQHKEPSRN
jgi:hypothetical protein